MTTETSIKSITPVQQPGGWRVRVRLQDGTERYHGTDARWTLHQAQVAADALRRDIAHRGEAHVLGTLEHA